ncbi:DUF3016 domain-containing protein [Luteimonas sp. SX5]|uniref:DUF3016 domain-containing protein n=1 Tax=Luteimonas galliterrae TaxID=2940486 RepID=A0ABT0MLB1_9GAMM|nr:DUF3016 domain-containing protein [Luteimonas galliterrae]MCL1635679.1 DUF3016 domain-containing protein [Luteimonas galliterrae]
MKFSSFAPTLLVGLLLAAPAAASSDVTDPKAPRSLPAEGRVDVSWTDPAQFSEIRQSNNRWEARRGDWVQQIAKYVRKRAEQRLPEGDRMSVTINDIRRAGQFEPWRGANVSSTRFVRDIYPPRIELSFTLTGADGRVIAQGERKLTDLAFLMNTPTAGSSDNLRYEKRLIDDWLSKEFKRPDA